MMTDIEDAMLSNFEGKSTHEINKNENDILNPENSFKAIIDDLTNESPRIIKQTIAELQDFTVFLLQKIVNIPQEKILDLPIYFGYHILELNIHF
ncbi:hypothetical protein KAH27_01950 [bacterium]|nr:hypothetical protein [bacterium]